jgi:hypothetical protein
MKKIQLTMAALISIAATLSAAADSWPGQHAPVGGALAAKIIGETCPGTLTSAEVAEIGRYIDNTVAIEKAKSAEDKALMEHLMPELEADYRSNRTCGVGDAELAKDMLLRVRKEVEAVR